MVPRLSTINTAPSEAVGVHLSVLKSSRARVSCSCKPCMNRWLYKLCKALLITWPARKNKPHLPKYDRCSDGLAGGFAGAGTGLLQVSAAAAEQSCASPLASQHWPVRKPARVLGVAGVAGYGGQSSVWRIGDRGSVTEQRVLFLTLGHGEVSTEERGAPACQTSTAPAGRARLKYCTHHSRCVRCYSRSIECPGRGGDGLDHI